VPRGGERLLQVLGAMLGLRPAARVER
jgi:hypothetical protein